MRNVGKTLRVKNLENFYDVNKMIKILKVNKDVGDKMINCKMINCKMILYDKL